MCKKTSRKIICKMYKLKLGEVKGLEKEKKMSESKISHGEICWSRPKRCKYLEASGKMQQSKSGAFPGTKTLEINGTDYGDLFMLPNLDFEQWESRTQKNVIFFTNLKLNNLQNGTISANLKEKTANVFGKNGEPLRGKFIGVGKKKW